MNRDKNIKPVMYILMNVLMILLVLSLFSSSALALGITPASKKADYKEGISEFTIKILNNENKDLKLRIKPQGELAQYVKVDDDLVVMYMDEREKNLRYSLDLPKGLKPGTRSLEIAVEEIIDDSKGTTSVKAAPEVIHTLHIIVPYPGKYAEAKLYIPKKNVGEVLTFSIPMLNLGSEDIKKASAKIKIYENGKEVAEVHSSDVSIPSQKEGKLELPWTVDVKNAGLYHAVATIEYDGEKITLEDDFYIGDESIDIVNVLVEKYNLGMVARFDIYLESNWNDNLTGVFGEMVINDKDGKELTRYKTAPVDLPPFGKTKIVSYWDTAGLGIGTYDVDLLLHYAGKITEKVFHVQVNIDSMKTTLTPTADVISINSGFKDNSLLIMLVLFIIVLNIILVLYLGKIKKKRQGD
jgi:hypothetical protein